MYDYKDLEKITLALSFLAYEGGEKEISKQQMNQTLEKYARWIGSYKTVWGPAYHKNRPPVLHDRKREQKVDAMTYIVQDSTNPDDFYIVIRGTTPGTLSEWVFQDFWVGAMVPWDIVPYEGIKPPPPPSSDTPAISFGTNIALNILVKQLKDPDNGVDIITFLQNQAKEAIKNGQKITFSVTGHSLGGALAPTFALYLNENWSTLTPTEIFKPEILTYAYAGPTAGNQKFVDLSNKVMGDHCKRFENSLDVVTHVWNAEIMKLLPTLYKYPQIPMHLLLEKILNNIAIPAIQDKYYTQVEVKQAEIPSKEAKFLTRYVPQMIYQHVFPYIAEFIRLCRIEESDQLIALIESWEIVKAILGAEPMIDYDGHNLQYFLDQLS
jgi:triacylglycerol lipase